jgi:hypothetical protein
MGPCSLPRRSTERSDLHHLREEANQRQGRDKRFTLKRRSCKVVGTRASGFCKQDIARPSCARDESLRWVQHTPENAKRNDGGAKQ